MITQLNFPYFYVFVCLYTLFSFSALILHGKDAAEYQYQYMIKPTVSKYFFKMMSYFLQGKIINVRYEYGQVYDLFKKHIKTCQEYPMCRV